MLLKLHLFIDALFHKPEFKTRQRHDLSALFSLTNRSSNWQNVKVKISSFKTKYGNVFKEHVFITEMRNRWLFNERSAVFDKEGKQAVSLLAGMAIVVSILKRIKDIQCGFQLPAQHDSSWTMSPSSTAPYLDLQPPLLICHPSRDPNKKPLCSIFDFLRNIPHNHYQLTQPLRRSFYLCDLKTFGSFSVLWMDAITRHEYTLNNTHH